MLVQHKVRVKVADTSNRSGLQALAPRVREPLASSAAFPALREKLFREACRMWNEKDKSKRPLIDVQHSG